ncbi:MAG: hypothetical protein ACRYHC_00485 [Janthinobacterium lividum]
MSAAAYLPSAYRGGASPRRRLVALLLALIVVALVIGMLLGLGVVPGLRRPEQKPMMATFSMLPPSEKPAAVTKTVKKENKAASGAAPKSVVPPTPHVAPPPLPPVPSAAPPKMLVLSKDQFASADIGALPSHNGEGEGDKGSGKDSAAPYGPGEGPGGAPLYPVRWYREPTSAELAFYVPKGGIPSGSANIACRMIEHYHVENCRELDESPIGSGLSRMLRQAAWQFLVVPPRRGGKEMLGEWVRIHFDWTERRAPAAESGGIAGGPGHPPPDDDSR